MTKANKSNGYAQAQHTQGRKTDEEWLADGDGLPTISKYNPAQFIIPGQDHQGHSEREWCRVQPLVDRDLDIILRSKKFPFRTKGDIIRYCIVRGIKHLTDLEPMPGLVGRANAINEMLTQEIYFQEFMNMFERLEKVVGQHITSGARGEAMRLIAITKAELMKIEEPYWKEKCLEELKRKFGHMSEKGSGVKAAQIHNNLEEGNGK